MATTRSSGRPEIDVVDQLGVGVGEGVGIFAPVGGTGAHHRVAEVGEVGVVELDIPTAGRIEGVELGAIAGCQVGEEQLQVRVGIEVDRRPPSAEVHHRR